MWGKLVVAAGAAMALGTALVTPAQGSTVVALWNMSEKQGATVLVDSGPNHLNGTIGAHVVLSGTAHTFPATIKRGDGGTVDPKRLDLVSSSLLNPGTATFSVTFRLRVPSVAASLGNVMQKGQTGTPGGFWKVQLDGGHGRILCSFVSPTGSGSIFNPKIIADNQWHVVTCRRTPTSVATIVDGVSATIAHPVGNISNTWPLSIGGKSSCSATPHHDCDYFIGNIDYVEVLKG
jgi:hypothetical protein